MAESKVIEPELSYKIVGIAYRVFKELGFGYQEKHYQRAYELELIKDKIGYNKENLAVLEYAGENIGNYRLDFLIDEKVIVEIKVGERIHQRDFNQVKAYLKKTGLKLGIIILFNPGGVKFERVLQISHYKNL